MDPTTEIAMLQERLDDQTVQIETLREHLNNARAALDAAAAFFNDGDLSSLAVLLGARHWEARRA